MEGYSGQRTCKRAIPTVCNLRWRRVKADACCPYCGYREEDSQHTLLTCSFVRLVWALSDLPWHIILFWSSDAEQWFRHCHDKLDKESYCYFLTLCWLIWSNRNTSIMDKLSTSPDILVAKARSFCSTYQEAFEEGPRLDREAQDNRWIPPKEGVIKVNFDGGVFPPMEATEAGCIARDSNGVCVAWRQQRF
ncbi:hypothetical protein BUALT_Bualt12G0100500 [Buddleja alternifolia]|uniref:Reverse transcriptase zinc-binding domain-containing protein n=1 Tax=Buddleja alternifolia TaxID=168488 RepID=A0AAV6WWB2_9LAMI|nr:hypothetical protein BUALT_Bualt12G0100500 [Buddleja alternifolia]